MKSLFEEALSLSSSERVDFIRDATHGDDTLAVELSSLLRAHELSDPYFADLAESVIEPALLALEARGDSDGTAPTGSVSHYELIERLGGGAMGVVYKARDTRLGRIVALKFLAQHHASDPAARARLVAEARAASRLDHPNIGVVYEIGEAADGRQFIAMAWYDGETLKARLRREPVGVAEAAAIAMQLANGLSAAHAIGMIHRDVKPANVMIAPSGRVTLVDFGIAKLATDDDTDRQPIAGTIPYMSPEQTEGKALDARTDIWSLGVILHEMLAGQRPFGGDSDTQVIAAIRSEKPRSIASLRRDLGPGMAAVVARCLEKDRQYRFQSASEFCDALAHLQRAVSRPRKRRTAALAAGIVTLAVASVFSWRYGHAAYVNHAAMDAPLRSIAILPFTSTMPGDDGTRFEVAVAEDLRIECGRIRSLTVPSYSSSRKYVPSRTSSTQTAKELHADWVLAGTVNAAAGGVALEVHLMDGRTGTERMSRRYVPGNLRTDVVRAAVRDLVLVLDIPLTQEQGDQLSRDRTVNARAYEQYLRGLNVELAGTPHAALGKPSPGSIRSAQGFYAQARSLDPGFSSARARLALSHMASAIAYDTTRSRLDQARLEAEAALRREPASPEPHLALAQYWSQLGETDRAIEELKHGLGDTPNNVSLHLAMGMRYLEVGRREEGVAELEHALRLDPRNPVAAAHVALASGQLNRNEVAMTAFNRAIAISPNDNEMKLIKGHFYLRWKGTADTLIAELRRIPSDWDERGMATFAWYTALRIQRKYRDGLAMLDRSKSTLSRDGIVLYYPTSLMRAVMLSDLGEMTKAKTWYERARDELADSTAADPSNASAHSALALADAGLQRRNDAIQEAQRAIDLARRANTTMSGRAQLGIAMEVFAKTGDLDRAFETMELLLAMPAGREAKVPYLKLWPGLDPLRKDPRFDELLQRFTAK